MYEKGLPGRQREEKYQKIEEYWRYLPSNLWDGIKRDISPIWAKHGITQRKSSRNLQEDMIVSSRWTMDSYYQIIATYVFG